jgi:serine O-acetyltransferase
MTLSMVDIIDNSWHRVRDMPNSSQVSATQPDWSREKKVHFLAWDPARSLLSSLRAYQRHAAANGVLSPLLRGLAVLRHRFWSIVTGADIPLNCVIEGGLLMPHANGIVIHPEARIGPNCLIFQQVTLGMRKGEVPTLGGHVDVGAGARVLGAITIGDHCEIGANAVVLADMPPWSVAVGVPASIRLRSPVGANPSALANE